MDSQKFIFLELKSQNLIATLFPANNRYVGDDNLHLTKENFDEISSLPIKLHFPFYCWLHPFFKKIYPQNFVFL